MENMRKRFSIDGLTSPTAERLKNFLETFGEYLDQYGRGNKDAAFMDPHDDPNWDVLSGPRGSLMEGFSRLDKTERNVLEACWRDYAGKKFPSIKIDKQGNGMACLAAMGDMLLPACAWLAAAFRENAAHGPVEIRFSDAAGNITVCQEIARPGDIWRNIRETVRPADKKAWENLIKFAVKPRHSWRGYKAVNFSLAFVGF